MLEKLADKFERKVKCLISTLCHGDSSMIVFSKLQNDAYYPRLEYTVYALLTKQTWSIKDLCMAFREIFLAGYSG